MSASLTGADVCLWQDVLQLEEDFCYAHPNDHFFIGHVIFSEILFSWTLQESIGVRHCMNYLLK